MIKESDIIVENGNYWVLRDTKNKQYVVYSTQVTHSVTDSAYPLTDDGKSIAITRCKYLARQR